QQGLRVSVKDLRRYYRQLFSNDALSRLVFGLAERVDEAARVRVPTFDTTGDETTWSQGQAADVYHALANPLRVKVVDSLDGTADHGPVNLEAVHVRFEVLTPDGGTLSDAAFDASLPYDPAKGSKVLPATVDPTSAVARVYW